MFRKATSHDLEAIGEIYDLIHDEEESGTVSVGWLRDVYPTRSTARAALAAGDLYVLEEGGSVVAAARINQEQMPEYALARWEHEACAEDVMVLHTLTVNPRRAGCGYGRRFVAFYEAYAREQGCRFLRMDTNALNVRARALYAKLGYSEAGIVPCTFNGIPNVQLVCLEKAL